MYVWPFVWRCKLVCMYGVLFVDASWCVCMAFCVKLQVGVYVWLSLWRCKLLCMYGVLFLDVSWCVCMAFSLEM